MYSAKYTDPAPLWAVLEDEPPLRQGDARLIIRNAVMWAATATRPLA